MSSVTANALAVYVTLGHSTNCTHVDAHDAHGVCVQAALLTLCEPAYN